MKIETGKIRKPWVTFTGYMIAASLIIIIFRMIFPGEPSPLPVFSRNWRFLKGLIDIITWFPALALSALVIPFGRMTDDIYRKSFSLQLFQKLVSPIINAICAAAIYALLVFTVLPLARNAEGNMRFRGEMYNLAKERLEAHVKAGEWLEASHFLKICDGAWENSPELDDQHDRRGQTLQRGLRTEVEINLKESLFREAVPPGTGPSANTFSDIHGHNITAVEAVALSRVSYSQGKFFDAHWYATLGRRLARNGSLEQAEAARIAALAWNQIEAQRPGERETAHQTTHRLKMSAYEAFLSDDLNDWIRAYYIFLELDKTTTGDPDIKNFLAASANKLKDIAFFVDEVEVSLSESLTGALFSLPGPNGAGRSVLRISGFSYTPDYAYGIGLEYMLFDSDARPLLTLQAPYAKFLPFTHNDENRVLVLMRTLDRRDNSRLWVPSLHEVRSQTVYNPDMMQIMLDVSYETFLMLSGMRRELPAMQLHELFTASKVAGYYGYIPGVFDAEVLKRLGSCLFFLPMTIFAIILGLHFRAKNRSRYSFMIMLPVLPLVFNGFVHACRSAIGVAGTSLVLAVGFSAALAILVVILVITFILSLILLAAYKS